MLRSTNCSEAFPVCEHKPYPSYNLQCSLLISKDHLPKRGSVAISAPTEVFRLDSDRFKTYRIPNVKVQLHYAFYQLRFYSNSLIHILLLSNPHNNVASIQKSRGDKSHRVIVALSLLLTQRFLTFRCVPCVKIKDTDDVLHVKEGPQLP